MASLVVLGAIYLEDRDSSQGMKNPVAVQSTQARRKEQQNGAVHLGNFVRVAKFYNPYEILQGCEFSQPATLFMLILIF